MDHLITIFARAIYTCPICSKLMHEPRQTVCDHYICRKCIVSRIHVENNATCPQCLRKLSMNDIRNASQIVDRSVEQLAIVLPVEMLHPDHAQEVLMQRQAHASDMQHLQQGGSGAGAGVGAGVGVGAGDQFTFGAGSFAINPPHVGSASPPQQTQQPDPASATFGPKAPTSLGSGVRRKKSTNRKASGREVGGGGFDSSNATSGEEGEVPVRTPNVTPSASNTNTPIHSAQQSSSYFSPTLDRSGGVTRTPTNPSTAGIYLEQLNDTERAESVQRRDIIVSWELEHNEISRRQASAKRQLEAARAAGNQARLAKQFKVEGDEAYEKADYKRAVDMYTKAVENFDGSSNLKVIYGNRSAALYMLHRYDECFADCLLVIEQEPHNHKLYHRAGKASVALGHLARAEIYLQNCLEEVQASNGAMPRGLEEDLARLRKWLPLFKKTSPFTADDYTQLVVAFPETNLFRFGLINCWIDTGLHDRAQEDAGRLEASSICKVPFNQCAIMFLKGRSLYLSGFDSFAKAKESLRVAVQAGSNVKHVFADLGNNPAFVDYLQEAVDLLEKVQQLDEYKHRGNSSFQQMQWQNAVQFYSSALDIDRTNTRVNKILYCNRAAAHKELGNYRQGVEDCSAAIAIDANFTKAYTRRARCFQEMGDYESAINDFKRASELDPRDNDIQQELRRAEQRRSMEANLEKDHYYVLAISRTASGIEIKAKFRELSLKWHPDKWTTGSAIEKDTAEKKFKMIAEAYATLSDADKKRAYDLKLSRERGRGAMGQDSHGLYSDPMAGMRSYGAGMNFKGGAGPSRGYSSRAYGY